MNRNFFVEQAPVPRKIRAARGTRVPRTARVPRGPRKAGGPGGFLEREVSVGCVESACEVVLCLGEGWLVVVVVYRHSACFPFDGRWLALCQWVLGE